MLAFLTAIALACGNPSETRLVGWAPDGRALVRVEHQDDDEQLHALELRLVDAFRTRTWSILTPEDHGDAKVRAQRWTAAAAELEALGVVLVHEPKPLAGPPGVVTTVPMPDGTVVRVQSYSFDRSTMRRTELYATRGERTVWVQVLLEAGNYGGGFAVARAHLDPTGRNLILMSYGVPPPLIAVDVGTIDAAFAMPVDRCPRAEHRVVGWGPDGSALVRSESQRKDEPICRLTMRWVGPHGTTRFPILEPGDAADASVREERWHAAEEALGTRGLTLVASSPLAGDPSGVGSVRYVELEGRPYRLHLSARPVRDDPAHTEVQVALHAKGHESVPLGALLTAGPGAFSYGPSSAWLHPDGGSLVFLPGYGPDEVGWIDLTAADTSWKGSSTP